MATSNTTLTSLWTEVSGQGSPIKIVRPVDGIVRTVTNGTELKRYYRDTGLEPVAKDVGILDANGELLGFRGQGANSRPVQMIAVPVQSPAKSQYNYKVEQTLIPKGEPSIASTAIAPNQLICGSAQNLLQANHIVTSKNTLIATPTYLSPESPQTWSPSVRKRPGSDLIDPDFSDGKRKKGEKGGKGLRHFSMKVCEKVQKKGITTYNEVADELVHEFSDPRNMNATDQAYDQKNIRRRVYDALNVLMAMNIISKEKKEIRWIGLPTNSAQECQNLEQEKQRRTERIRHKTQQLQELILQQIAFKNLVERNRNLQTSQGTPTTNSAIQLPFIIVNTSKKTVIDCSISNDKYEYLFNFDDTFEIHDDIEVLKRMGLAYGLERGACNRDDLVKATKMIPKVLEPYIIDLAKTNQQSGPQQTLSVANIANAGTSNSALLGTPVTKYAQNTAQSPLATPLPGTSSMDMSADAEVASAMAQAPSWHLPPYGSMIHSSSRESPEEEGFSDVESERSSPFETS